MGTLVKSNRNLFPTFPSMFDDFFTKDMFNWNKSQLPVEGMLPAVNVMETEGSYQLEVAAPGMTKKDFKVEMSNDMLLISAEREMKNEEKDRDGNYTRREFGFYNFSRSFSLPERLVQGDKIVAHYENGILFITIPKTEVAKAKARKLIKIT